MTRGHEETTMQNITITTANGNTQSYPWPQNEDELLIAMKKLGRANASIFNMAMAEYKRQLDTLARANKSEFKGTSNGRGRYTIQPTGLACHQLQSIHLLASTWYVLMYTGV